MLATLSVIESLAERIERAYRLRRPGWYGAGTTYGAWTGAAGLLHRIHRDDPEIPLDPELFVAVQPLDPAFIDPWGELTQPESARRYRARVRQIIRGLRAELRGEVRRAEGRIGRGEAIERVLGEVSADLSPLGGLIAAERAGRPDLARRHRVEAIRQYRSCPLYHRAVLDLLPPADCPSLENLFGRDARPDRRVRDQIRAS